MLDIERKIQSSRATQSKHGDIELFLERLCVEVTAENYRYFLEEALWYDSTVCLPPLLANERQLSGLFAAAISRICPISRPEWSLRRQAEVGPALAMEESEEPGGRGRVGRIDFHAIYNWRAIGVELKRQVIGSRDGIAGRNLSDRWEAVVNQAKTAFAHVRDGGDHPVTIGLLVIPVRSKVKLEDEQRGRECLKSRREKRGEFSKSLYAQLRPKADFLACYELPEEMSLVDLSGDEYEASYCYSHVYFAAKVHTRGPKQPAKRS